MSKIETTTSLPQNEITSLTSDELVWLQALSVPSGEMSYDSLPPIKINSAIRRQEVPREVLVDESARLLLEQYAVPSGITEEMVSVLGKFRYDQPQKILNRISKYPFTVDFSKSMIPKISIQDFHDVDTQEEHEFVYGNCVVLANHLSVRLHALNIMSALNECVRHKSADVYLTVENGHCDDLFSQKETNHWYCALHFMKDSQDEVLILDPSFRRITTDKRYHTFENQCQVVYTAAFAKRVVMDMAHTEYRGANYTNMALGCSSDYKLAYALSFHTDGQGVLPILTVFWDVPERGTSEYVTIYVDQIKGLPKCNYSVTAALPLKNRIQIVQCLSELNKFKYQFGDIAKK